MTSRRRVSVGMTAGVHTQLRDHLLRLDGQEDIRLVAYRPSTGATRRTAILRDVISPLPGERAVHGNASITGDYILRAAAIAHDRDEGLALCHSHPGGMGWQSMSGPDRDAESSYANLVREITGLPLVGMTLAGRDSSWSARHWDHGLGTAVGVTDAENVRIVSERLTISWNDSLVPPPRQQATQRRSVSCWGPATHDDLVRRSVLVIGAGSVGLDVALRLAATGLTSLGIMDFDTVEQGNLDRLIGATATDVWLRRAKVDVARRLMLENTTAHLGRVAAWEHSICEPDGLMHALDFDLIICCVDSPWPRAVLNSIAYSDLIPVIDGGIAVDVFPGGEGMRNATWRSHVIRPGRPCMSCNGQLDLGAVAADIEGVLDDPQYIAGRNASNDPATGQNVAVLSISAAGALLAQYVSLNIAPGGIGDPGPLQYLLSTHTLEHLRPTSGTHCSYEAAEAAGDTRQTLTGRHLKAENRRAERDRRHLPLTVRAARSVDNIAWQIRRRLWRAHA